MTVISPSLLSADFSDLKGQINEINESEAEWIHYDVMDGHFVPNLTFGPDILKTIGKLTDKFLDVHIMVSNPLEVIDYFRNCKVGMMTFHYEACKKDEIISVIEKCREYGFKAGISIKPATDPEVLEDVLPEVDMVLVMSVEPGFGGQSFMPVSLDKLDWLDQYRKDHDLHYLLEIDGGINAKTGKLAVEHHCDVLVAGSYIFRHPLGIKEGVRSLL